MITIKITRLAAGSLVAPRPNADGPWPVLFGGLFKFLEFLPRNTRNDAINILARNRLPSLDRLLEQLREANVVSDRGMIDLLEISKCLGILPVDFSHFANTHNGGAG